MLQSTSSKRSIFLGIILISLGIVMNNSSTDSLGTFGTVMIALGGFFFIVGMKRKRD